MFRKNLLILFLLASPAAFAQVQVGLFGGVSAYNGDLTEKIFPKRVTNGAIGITGTYSFTDKISARAGFTYSMVGAADRYNEDLELQQRNLSFETRIFEFSLMGEYDFFSLSEKRFTPYVVGGVAVFRFDPYIYWTGKEKVYLQPLSTEGQGIDGYGDPYKLTQLAIPFGAGVKYAINDNLTIGIEGHLRKLFTDYLDDVSTSYADYNTLLLARGQRAVDIAYRGDEVAGGNPAYPSQGSQRGSPDTKDYYYFAGLHLSYSLSGGNGVFGGGGGRGKLGCPTNIY
jgi:opacity protein-like surface antigen